MARSMASNEDGGCFDLFSDDDSDWDANPDYEDWDSEGDLDAASIEDEIADGETTRSTASAAGPSATARIGSGDKKKQLNKGEKKRLVDAVRQTDVDKLLVDCLAQLDKQLHFTVFEERGQFLQALSRSKDDLKLLCKTMIGDFCRVYESCGSGKDKYTRFVLQWHQHCSSFLMDPAEDQGWSPDEDNSQRIWNRLSPGVDASIKNPVMISFCAAVFDNLSICIRTLLSGTDRESVCTDNIQLEHESDDVHLRFCGAALATMYQERYKKMKSKAVKNKDDVSKELTVLDWIRMTDKNVLPESLKYKDEGGMYFPHLSFIPFVRAVDECVQEHANEMSFNRYGSKLVQVATHQLKSNQLLKPQFISTLSEKVEGGFTGYEQAVDSVYHEMVRKLCNTRLNEFITSHQHSVAREKGSATLSGQNLRDSLLTQHTNLATRTRSH